MLTQRCVVYCEPQNNLRGFDDMGRQFGSARLPVVLLAAAWFVGLSCGAARADSGPAGAIPLAVPLSAPVVQNPGLECKVGYVTQDGIQRRVPLGWTGVLLSGAPQLDSARIRWGAGGCTGSGFVEHLEGEDNLVFVAQDLETPPAPGKPFDAAVYQQVTVTPGAAYSLSGWMVSMCGGSATPSSCPTDYYMEKLLGIDPTGGADPLGPNVFGSAIGVTSQRAAGPISGSQLQLKPIGSPSSAGSAAPSNGTAITRLWMPSAWCAPQRHTS